MSEPLFVAIGGIWHSVEPFGAALWLQHGALVRVPQNPAPAERSLSDLPDLDRICHLCWMRFASPWLTPAERARAEPGLRVVDVRALCRKRRLQWGAIPRRVDFER